ncbi:hypothetical protein IJH74_00670 [Candidatus Saccharibacteria bacterium]|nr:hypothetical protein [Candidatus Saccharibacteria bacterium]
MKRLITTLLAALLLVTPVSAKVNSNGTILDDKTLDMYAKNGIYYYNPYGSNTCHSFSGDVTVYGTTINEKIWTGLTSFMTEEQAAGVMGNMLHESHFNPVIHEVALANKYPDFDLFSHADISYGIGLIGWSFQRRVDLLEYIKSQDANLIDYFIEREIYSDGYAIDGDKLLELAGEDTTDALIAMELQFLKDELETKWPDFFNTNSVYDAAVYFLEKVEVPKNPYISAHPERATDAEAFYETFANSTIEASDKSVSTFNNGANLNIIGDSITEGSKDKILEKLPEATIDSRVGRPWSEGYEILKNLTVRDNLIYELGSNSPNLTEDQITKVIDEVGNHNLYLVTNYSTRSDLIDGYNHNNELLKKVSDNNSNIYLIDWAKAVSEDPEKFLASDGLHPSVDGQNLLAELYANALTSHTNSSNGCVTASGDAGALQELVLQYAWPEYHSAPFVDMRPDYEDAINNRLSTNKYVGGIKYRGVDCGGFVTTLLQESGFEPEYNTPGGDTYTQENWVKEHGWTLLNDSPTTEIDTTILEPGDVAFSPGHTFIYVGNIPGFESKIASASLDERAPMAGGESLTYGNGAVVKWYRKGN